MVRPRSGPTLKKLMVLTVVLGATVLAYRMMASMQIDLVSKQSYNRVYYEQLYSDVSNEVADWRQRYDKEFARAEEEEKSLIKLQSLAKTLEEENETLKAELTRLRQQVKEDEASRML